MKKASLVLLLWLCACCLIFGQVSSSKRKLFTEANGMVGKRVPSGWVENGGIFWKSLDFAIGKEYSSVQPNGNIVEQAIVGSLFADSRAQSRWLKESYDTLVADKWEFVSDNGGVKVLMKGDRMVSLVPGNNGNIGASVVFVKWK